MKKNMSVLISCCFLAVIVPIAEAKRSNSGSGGSHHVNGHFKKNGTYVAPHRSTNPNHTQRDNWSSKPNANPYNGKQGTKEPDH